MIESQTVELNHNTAQCIKSAANLTKTIYYNICTGVQTEVPMGAWDWIGTILLVSFGVACVIGAFAFALMILSNDL